MSEENRKATVPDSSILAEVIKVSVKLDEMKRGFGNELLSVREDIRVITNRVDMIESGAKRGTEEARRAMKSASDLADHVKSTEAAMKVAVDKMGDRIGDVEGKVDSMAAEQTPLLREIRKEQIEKAAREKVVAELRSVAIAEATEAAKKVTATRSFRLKLIGAIGVIVIGVVPAITSYLAARQANADSPRPVQIQQDAGTVK